MFIFPAKNLKFGDLLGEWREDATNAENIFKILPARSKKHMNMGCKYHCNNLHACWRQKQQAGIKRLVRQMSICTKVVLVDRSFSRASEACDRL